MSYTNDKGELFSGDRAKIKATGQVVEVKRWSQHGIAVIRFRTGGEYILPVHKLEPVASAA